MVNLRKNAGKVAWVLALAAVLVGVGVLSGCVLDVNILQRLISDLVAMSPAMAIAYILGFTFLSCWMAKLLMEASARRKNTQAMLLRQQTELQVLFDLMPAMIWFKDTENRFLRANQRVAEVTGKSVEDIVGKSAQENYPKEAAKYYADDLEVIRSGTPKLGIIETIRDQAGREIWVQTDKVPYFDAKGKVIGILVMAQDITERKRTEEIVQRLAAIVENSADAIISKTLQGIATSWNPAAEIMFGYSAAEIIGRSLSVLVPPDRHDEETQILAGFARGEPARRLETVRLRKNGERFDVYVTISPIKDPQGIIVGISKIVRDITVRKRFEAQLLQSQKLETVGRLAGGVAHEFNSILTAIIGQSELLLGDLPPGSPLTNNAIEISQAAGRAAALTRQLLAYGRKQILQPEILDLNTILAGMAGTLRHLLGPDTDVLVAPGGELKTVKADCGQIEQVIMNLVMNAAEAMPHGGKLTLETANVTLDSEYAGRVPGLSAGEYVMLAVTDTGPGMTEEVKARAFEPFFSTKEVGQGTGLGLPTCYGIIKQSGGHISLYSELGRGTTCKIYLPQVEPLAVLPLPRLDSPDLPRGTESILLVEDDPALREMAATLLKRLGYAVIPAANGVEALRMKQQRDTGHIDLLFTDVVMPQMSGRELSERVRALSPATRVLFTSAYTENAIIHQGVLNQGVTLLQKPFTPSALAHKLRAVLDAPAPTATTQ